MAEREWMPWLDAAWQRTRERLANDSLPHALLFTGSAGTGKRRFARRLVEAFLCTAAADERPCGKCRDCRLMAAGHHADFHVLSPEEGKRELNVDQVRGLGARLMLSGGAGRRAAVLDPAHALNRSSANAFLKTLEEPPPGVLLILVAENPSRLPATILSRCQRMGFLPPNHDEASEWLARQGEFRKADMETALRLSGDAPGEALRLLEEGAVERQRATLTDLKSLAEGGTDPVSVAEAWLKEPLADRLQWLARWLSAAARPVSGAGSPLQPMLEGVDWRRIFELYDRVNETRALLETQLRQDLLLETLLMDWVDARGRAEVGHA